MDGENCWLGTRRTQREKGRAQSCCQVVRVPRQDRRPSL